MSAVAGTHSPGRGEGVEGLRCYLGDIIIFVVVGVSCKDSAKCWKVNSKHPPGRAGGVERSPVRYQHY